MRVSVNDRSSRCRVSLASQAIQCISNVSALTTFAVIVLGCSTPRVHTVRGSGGAQFQQDTGPLGGTHVSEKSELLDHVGGRFAFGGTGQETLSSGGALGTSGGAPASVGGTSASAASIGGTSGTLGSAGAGGTATSSNTSHLGGTATGGAGTAITIASVGGLRASGGATPSAGANSLASGGRTFGTGGRLDGSGGGGLSTGGDDAGLVAVNYFSFFAFGDTHLGQGEAASKNFDTALAQMEQIEPNALAAFSNGDLVDDTTASNWALVERAIQLSIFRKDIANFDGPPRFLGVLGNHDVGIPPRADWLTQWNQHLPAQVSLGHNGTDGVYYAVRHRDALIIALDSQHPSTAQTDWLRAQLSGELARDAKAKIALFHQPVYPCSTAHGPFKQGLAWVDLFEKYGVRLVLVSHLHDYERTCPMRGGVCSPDDGIVYINLSPVGATNYRNTDRAKADVVGETADGRPRTDRYDCAGAEKILDFSRAGTNGFCQVKVDGCRVSGGCFLVGSGNSLPFDSWHVNMCDS